MDEFLKYRFSPSIFCHISKELNESVPNISEIIDNAYKEAEKTFPLKFRLIFHKKQVDAQKIQENMKNIRLQQASIGKYQVNQSIEYLIKSIFDLEFAPLYFFPDLPVGTLIFILGNEVPTVDYDFYPEWTKPYLSKLKRQAIRYSEDLVIDISNIFKKYFIVQYSELVISNEQNYNNQWIGVRKFFSTILHDALSLQTTLKCYADIQVQQGEYEKASTSYAQLLDYNPNEKFRKQILFCAAISDILNKSITKQTLNYLTDASNEKPSDIFSIKCTLYEFYVRKQMKLHPEKALFHCLQSPFLQKHFSSFLMEEISNYLTPHKSIFYLSYSGKTYIEIGLLKVGFDCMRIVNDFLLNEKWPLLGNELSAIISRSSNENIIELLSGIFNSNYISFPEQTKNYFEHIQNDFCFSCKFIFASVISFETKGFIGSIPKGIEPNEWNNIKQLAFNGLSKDTFFNNDMFNKRESVINEPIKFKLMIKMNNITYDLNDFTLLVNGNVKTYQKPINITKNKISFDEIEIIPLNEGVLELYGIKYNWGGIVHLETTFQHNPIKIVIHKEVPLIKMNVNNIPNNNTLTKGQIIKLDFELENNSFPITNIGVLAIYPMKCYLIKPIFNELSSNIISLGSFNTNEKKYFSLVFSCDQIGEYNFNVLIPYWDNKMIPRYESYNYNFKIIDYPTILSHIINTKISIKSPKLTKAIGFTGILSDIKSYHLLIHKRNCKIDFVASENINNKIDLPKYCEPFILKNSLYFWYKNDLGYVYYEMKLPKIPISILMKKLNKLKYSIQINNISNITFKSITIGILCSDENVNEFIVIGTMVKKAEVLKPNHSINFNVSIIMFGKIAKIPIFFASEEFASQYEIEFQP